jgi:hypothetical protein
MTIEEIKTTLQGLPPSNDGETTARNMAKIIEVLQALAERLPEGVAKMAYPNPEQEGPERLPPVPPRAPPHKARPVHHVAKKHTGKR